MGDDLRSDFNLQEWKEQGRIRVKEIDKLLGENEGKMIYLQKVIDDLNGEKVEILTLLDNNKDRYKVNSVHKKKVIIRPVLLERLMSSKTEVSVTDLIDYVQEEKPSASTKSIKISLSRLVKEHPKISETDDGVRYHHEPELVDVKAS